MFVFFFFALFRPDHCCCTLLSEGDGDNDGAHPTAMLLTSTVNLLKTLSLSAGIHAEVMQLEATRTLCGLLRMLVESGVNDKTGTSLCSVDVSRHYSCIVCVCVIVCALIVPLQMW